MKITTNNFYRPIICWNELTESEQSEFADLYDDIEESSFFRYRGQVYDLSDFLTVNGHCMNGQKKDSYLEEWDGYKNETFFSSILVKFSEDNEFLKVGMAIS